VFPVFSLRHSSRLAIRRFPNLSLLQGRRGGGGRGCALIPGENARPVTRINLQDANAIRALNLLYALRDGENFQMTFHLLFYAPCCIMQRRRSREDYRNYGGENVRVRVSVHIRAYIVSCTTNFLPIPV